MASPIEVRRITVGVAFTDASRSALLDAAALARALGAEVVLAHAVADPEDDVLRAHAGKLLARLQDELAAEGVQVQAPHRLRGGEAADVLRAVAEETRSDLIVVGAGEKTVTDRLLLGSTAERLTRESPVPVWLTRPGLERRRLGRILCAVDGSDLAAEVLGAAAGLARALSARLDVLTVVAASAAPGTRGRVQTLDPAPADRPRGPRTAEGEAVDQALAGVELHGVERRVLVREGTPAARIIECAAEVEADLLVIGSAGRRGLARLARGNTAEKVIRQLPCSTLVVPRARPA